MAELVPERGLSAALTRAATVLAFADEIRCDPTGLLPWRRKVTSHKTAIFRQFNKERLAVITTR